MKRKTRINQNVNNEEDEEGREKARTDEKCSRENKHMKNIKREQRRKTQFRQHGQQWIRRLFVTCGVFTRYFFVAFSWLFRGPLLSRKTVFGPFSLLFRGFFVVFSWLFRGPRFGQILRVLALEQSSEWKWVHNNACCAPVAAAASLEAPATRPRLVHGCMDNK